MTRRWPCIVLTVFSLLAIAASAECPWVWWSSSVITSARPLAIGARVRYVSS